MLISEQTYSFPLMLVIKEVQMMLCLPSQQEITYQENTWVEFSKLSYFRSSWIYWAFQKYSHILAIFILYSYT